MMLHLSMLGFMAMACSVAQLSSFPLDDMSTLALDQGESDLSPFFDEDWSSSPSYSLLDMSNNFFDEPETDASTHLLDDFSSLSPSGEASIDTIAAVNECQSNPTQADRIQRREEENQCFDNPPAKITIEEMINEQIKRKWCSRLPWLAFGNIPVVRFTDSFIFPVLPGAHLDLPLNTIPISGYYNVLKAALLTFTIESLVHATDVWCCDVFTPDQSPERILTPLIEGTGYVCFQGTREY